MKRREVLHGAQPKKYRRAHRTISRRWRSL
jgi:hypothetical protein